MSLCGAGEGAGALSRRWIAGEGAVTSANRGEKARTGAGSRSAGGGPAAGGDPPADRAAGQGGLFGEPEKGPPRGSQPGSTAGSSSPAIPGDASDVPADARSDAGRLLFDRVQHQAAAVAALRSAWERGRAAHAVLLWGPEGVGKTRAAHGLAQQLLCSSPAAPCGRCSACRQVGRFTHPDIHVILAGRAEASDHQKALEAFAADLYHCWEMPANASIGIERIRALKAESSKTRVGTGNRVILIRDAERMTAEAAQAALKLIEEPQAGTYLILTCRDPEQLLPTILSRCQRVRFRPLPTSYIRDVLGRLEHKPDRKRSGTDALSALAAMAQGSLGRALSMAHEDLLALRAQGLDLFETRLGDLSAVRAKVRPLERPPGKHWNPERARVVVDILMRWYEDLLLVRGGVPVEQITNLDQRDRIQERARQITLAEIKHRIAILEELLAAIGQNVNPLLALQTALLRVNRLSDGSGLEP